MTMLPRRSTWVLIAVFVLTLMTYLLVRPAAAVTLPVTQAPVTSNRTVPAPRATVSRTATAPPSTTTTTTPTPTQPTHSTTTFAPTASPTFAPTPSPTFPPTTAAPVPPVTPTDGGQPTSSGVAPSATPT